jgi:glycosyltransferase involved in cell wall biosynthesis
MQPLRIAIVAPVATSIPPAKSGSVQSLTSLLVEGLVDAGHSVTLFATGDSRTRATLHATFDHGYWHDPTLWPWEMYELANLSAAARRDSDFDVLHYHTLDAPLALAFAALVGIPFVQTVHHAPDSEEVALWARCYPTVPFIAISREQQRRMPGVRIAAVVPHAVDTPRFTYRAQPDDYLLFLGRFTEGKGVLQAIAVAKRAGMKLILAAADEPYYREKVAPLVDGQQIVYAGEADFETKVRLYGGARALLYPVQAAEPFGLVMAEAMTCGTPVAALDRGAVREVVDDGVTGIVFEDVDGMAAGLTRVLALDRAEVHRRAAARFSPGRMVQEYADAYRRIIEAHRRGR